jgi:hypothetical protein
LPAAKYVHVFQPQLKHVFQQEICAPRNGKQSSACRLSKRKIDLYLTPRSFYCPSNPQLRHATAPYYRMAKLRQIIFTIAAPKAISDFQDDPSKLRQWLTALHFLDPSLHPGHIIYHKLRVTTQDIEDWVTHLRDHGGYVYLRELIAAKRAMETFPMLGIKYTFDAERLVIEKREGLKRAAEGMYTDGRLFWDSFIVSDAELGATWFNVERSTSANQCIHPTFSASSSPFSRRREYGLRYLSDYL